MTFHRSSLRRYFIKTFFVTFIFAFISLSCLASAQDMKKIYGEYELNEYQNINCPKDIIIKDGSYEGEYRLRIVPTNGDYGEIYRNINRGVKKIETNWDEGRIYQGLTTFENDVLIFKARECSGRIIARSCSNWLNVSALEILKSKKIKITNSGKGFWVTSFPANESCLYSLAK
jgi:hypothetical protein